MLESAITSKVLWRMLHNSPTKQCDTGHICADLRPDSRKITKRCRGRLAGSGMWIQLVYEWNERDDERFGIDAFACVETVGEQAESATFVFAVYR